MFVIWISIISVCSPPAVIEEKEHMLGLCSFDSMNRLYSETRWLPEILAAHDTIHIIFLSPIWNPDHRLHPRGAKL